MKKVVLSGTNPDISVVKQAVDILKKGGIVALPTETVYGLGVISNNKDAVKRLFEVKKRPKDKPFTLCFPDRERATSFLSIMPPFAYRMMEVFWPGPLTIIFYSKDSEKIGVRVPSNPIIQMILQELNIPVCLPSANISGQKDAVTAEEVADIFDDNIDLIVDGGSASFSKPSTVVDITYHPFKVLREGVIHINELMKIFFRKRIMFVCTGNTCRSPMAEYILKNILSKSSPYVVRRYEIISRGIIFLDNQPISNDTYNILKEKENIDASSHRSQKIDRDVVLSSDLIFVMEEIHREHIVKIEPTSEPRIFPLKKFLPPNLERDIPDPIGKSYDFYEEVYSLLRKAIEELSEWLLN